MTESTHLSPIPAIVLAGERPGGNALARAHGLSASVLVDVDGFPAITRVITALRGSGSIAGGCIVGPRAPLHEQHVALRELFSPGDYAWLAPAAGPSASALLGSRHLARFPILLTAADHALLTPTIIDEFCGAALNCDADFVIGLVPYDLVMSAYPATRRTRLRFSDGSWCGANLFLARTARGECALELWRALEQHRKQPWRIARRLGATTLWRYVRGKLSLDSAMAELSAHATAKISAVPINHARAAVDVDSAADLALATEILGHERA